MNSIELKITDLSFKYPSWSNSENPEILSGLSLELKAGEIVIIFGGAESGKSTLALILAALVPLHTGGRITGEVHLNSIDVLKIEPADIIENCGIIFQDPEKQTVTTECFTEAAFALESLGVHEDDIKEKIKASFTKLKINHLLDAAVSETSGGEKKKLALAGLFCVNPDIWVLDETIEELDNPSRMELLKLLRDTGKTIIIFTSKYFKAFSDADSFYLLKDGKLSNKKSYPFERNFKSELVMEGIIPKFGKMNTRNVSEEIILRAENIKYSYEGGGFKLCVDNFHLNEGEIISIVGRNGCGKSTLARILCGLIAPDNGRLLITDDENTKRSLTAASQNRLNAFCAYMFQNPDYQIFLPTVFDELSWGLKEAGFSSDVIKAMVEKTIYKFKLPGSATPPAMMSFSARKRLQAAIYYLLKRPVFILDEADTGLSFTDFTDLCIRLKKTCRGLIIITHNLELASAVSDRVLGMSNGNLYDNILNFAPDKLNEWLTESGERAES